MRTGICLKKQMYILRTEFIQNIKNTNNIPDIFPEFMAPELSELHLNGIVVKEAHLKGYKQRGSYIH